MLLPPEIERLKEPDGLKVLQLARINDEMPTRVVTDVYISIRLDLVAVALGHAALTRSRRKRGF